MLINYSLFVITACETEKAKSALCVSGSCGSTDFLFVGLFSFPEQIIHILLKTQFNHDTNEKINHSLANLNLLIEIFSSTIEPCKCK